MPGGTVVDRRMWEVEGGLSNIDRELHNLEEAAATCCEILWEVPGLPGPSIASVGSPAEWVWDSMGYGEAPKSPAPRVLALPLQTIYCETLDKYFCL